MSFTYSQDKYQPIDVGNEIKNRFESSIANNHAYWIGLPFRKPFYAWQKDDAVKYAVSRSGVYSNFLKCVSVKWKTHIWPYLVFDFMQQADGSSRIHIHGVLISENKIQTHKVKKMWKAPQYGTGFVWNNYNPDKGGIPYMLQKHYRCHWSYPACPQARSECRGKKGCKYKRIYGQCLTNRSSESETSSYGKALSAVNQNPLNWFDVPLYNNSINKGGI